MRTANGASQRAGFREAGSPHDAIAQSAGEPALDRTVRFGMHQIETSGFGVSNRIMSGQVNAEILISGSSRALTHYESKVIEEMTKCSTFNIGRNGSQTDMQLAFLKTYLKNNSKPKLIIHNLDLYSFQTSKEIYDPAQYMPYLDQTPIYEGSAGFIRMRGSGSICPFTGMWRKTCGSPGSLD